MRSSIIVISLLLARVVAAEPVTFELQREVSLGKKPQIRITAAEPVAEVRVELDRNDGKHFSLRHGSLARGAAVTLAIGDGAAGVATYKGTLSAKPAGAEPWTNAITFETVVRSPLSVGYDADHLDLDKRVLQFKPSRAIADASLVVIGEDGKELGKGAATYTAGGNDGWLAISWTQPANTAVMMMKLRVVAGDGMVTNVELVPWSVVVEHEDVNFRTDSAVIDPDETKKLDASFAKIADIIKRTEKVMKLKLYVAGHTDTVGPPAKNAKLSLARAQAIGEYLRKHGLAIPIAVAGYGDKVLKVPTPDETDERANRRADYVIGPADGAPPFKGPYAKVKPAWKQLR